jgi:lipopolysaccharide/colanic/teichoic acid biosynthesis glycosyltransferase
MRLIRCVALAVALTLLIATAVGWHVTADHVLSMSVFAAVLVLMRYLLFGLPAWSGEPGWALPPVRDAVMATVLAGVAATLIGFVGGIAVSRRLLLLAGAMYLLADSATVWWQRLHPAMAETRLAVVCDQAEFTELTAELREQARGGYPSRPRFSIWVRLGDPLAFSEDSSLGAADRGWAPVANMKSVCADLGIGTVLVGQGWLRDPGFLRLAEEAQEAGLTLCSLSGFFERHFMRVPLSCLDPVWFFDLNQDRRATYRRLQQGVVWLAAGLSGVVLLVLGPLIALAVLVESGRPILHRQQRVGLGGRSFSILKFRTMRQNAESDGAQFAAVRDPRITRVGRILRRTRLDELPQLINILRREMTFIGPRPERPEFVGGYTSTVPYYARRHALRPGLTGWAQVNNDYTATLAGTMRKLEHDLFYLKYQSVGLDAIILVRTVRSIVHLKGR